MGEEIAQRASDVSYRAELMYAERDFEFDQ